MQTQRQSEAPSKTALPRMMLIKDLAKETGITYSSIRRWCLSGEFSGFVKVGNRYLINVNLFADFLNGGGQ